MKKNKFIDVYDLSPMQEGMLFHSLYEASHAYFQQITMELKGHFEVVVFENAINSIIAKYDIFRTVFLHERLSKPRQVVLAERKLKVDYKDFTDLTEVEQRKQIESFKQQDKERGFDLSKDLLMRFTVIQTQADRYFLIWSFHHILMDGWSLGIVMNELFQLYQQMIHNQSPYVGKAVSYSKYIRWLAEQDREKAHNYWKTYLKDYSEAVGIPRLTSHASGRYTLKERRFIIDAKLTKDVIELARSLHVTPNIVFQTIWGILLQKYNQTDDVVFGSVVSGRPSVIPQVEKMVGLFINTVPVRVQRKRGDTFAELATRAQEILLSSEPYSYLSLADIQSETELGHHLINHLFVFENYPIQDSLRNDAALDQYGFQVLGIEAFEQTNYDLNVTVFPGEEFLVKVTFNAEVYADQMIENVVRHLKQILSQVVCNPDLPVEQIDLLSEEEKQQLLFRFNETRMDYPREKTIHALFEEQVEKTPDQIAV
ncbi:condensation domain-containing protein, partial [Thermoflavimicrobium dichotomicum]